MAKNEDRISNIVSGVLLGALAGGGLGLGACMFVFERTLLFPGDTMLAGAVICGALGGYFGEGFIEWLRDNLWWFW